MKKLSQKNWKSTQKFCLLSLVLLTLAGCAVPPTTEDPANTPQPTAIPTRAEPTKEAPAETKESAQLSEQPYISPAEAFSIFFPEGWNCSESGLFQTDCQSPQGDAAITVRVTGTGYELFQKDFENLVQAEQVSLYGDKKAYTEVSKDIDAGIVSEVATWREGEQMWQSEDQFHRAGAGVFQIHFRAHPEQWAAYEPIFMAVGEGATFTPQALYNQPIYAATREYTAQKALFKLDVPTTWTRYVDAAWEQGTVLEGFTSPDGRAAVQVIVFEQATNFELERKSFKTLELLRSLLGFEWKVTADRPLPIGLEQLEWYSPRFDVYGNSYFDTYRNILYIFNIVWDEQTEELYLPVLEKVAESFRY